MHDVDIRTITVGEYEGATNLPFLDDTVLYQVTVYGRLYQEIKGYVDKWWSENAKAASDPNGYSAGIKDSPSINGAIGEFVVATVLFNEENSIKELNPDAGWDYIHKGAKYDVKTTGMKWSFWITVSDVKKNQRVQYPLDNTDWYVGVHEDNYHLDEGWTTVTLLGRVRWQDVKENTKREPGKRPEEKDCRHFVRKVPFSLLEPMPPLADLSVLIG